MTPRRQGGGGAGVCGWLRCSSVGVFILTLALLSSSSVVYVYITMHDHGHGAAGGGGDPLSHFPQRHPSSQNRGMSVGSMGAESAAVHGPEGSTLSKSMLAQYHDTLERARRATARTVERTGGPIAAHPAATQEQPRPTTPAHSDAPHNHHAPVGSRAQGSGSPFPTSRGSGGGGGGGGDTPRNLVVGLGTGILPENLAVFAGSLRRVAPRSSLVLYLDAPLPKMHQRIVQQFNITAVEFHEELIEPAFLRKYHPSNYRWPLLYRFVSEHAQHYDKVLLADTRDTMFQTDPFARFDRGFYAFNGVESRTIGQCGWNGGWIRDCFGGQMVSKLHSNAIICSGVSMGSTEAVLHYLRSMKEIMETSQFATCERNGVDQGVHNVLVHTGRLTDLHIHTQSNGWVANMQAQVARFDRSSMVVKNRDGQSVAVVHQYDRYRELTNHYYDAYIFWERETDESLCSAYTVREGVELFKGRCDLKVSNAHSVGACCERCRSAPGCKGWSLAGSQCFLKNCNRPQTNIPMRGVASGYLH